MDPQLVSKAIVMWAGWGQTAYPRCDDQVLISAFGPDVGAELISQVHSLGDDFYASDARFTVGDLVQMGDRAAEDFRVRHPEIAEEAVQALRWCYTFDYR